jgi:hypothetical protein
MVMFESCLLVKMTRKRPASEKLDTQASYNYNTEKDTDIKIYKDLFKGDRKVNALNNAYSDAYQYHIHHTLPWLDRGLRIIDNTQYLNYMQKMGDFRNEIDKTLKEIEPVYDAMVVSDLGRLKELGNALDYPAFTEFARAWQLVVEFRPVPQAGDYRVAVAQEVADGLQQQLQDLGVTTQAMLKNNLKTEFKEFFENLAKADGERRLFESSLTNLVDLVERTKVLNVLNDATLTNVLDRLTTVIALYDIKDLRKFPEARVEFTTSISKELEPL